MTDLKYLEECMNEGRLISRHSLMARPHEDIYLRGTAGSLVMICPDCGGEVFREWHSVLENPQYCVRGCEREAMLIRSRDA